MPASDPGNPVTRRTDLVCVSLLVIYAATIRIERHGSTAGDALYGAWAVSAAQLDEAHPFQDDAAYATALARAAARGGDPRQIALAKAYPTPNPEGSPLAWLLAAALPDPYSAAVALTLGLQVVGLTLALHVLAGAGGSMLAVALAALMLVGFDPVERDLRTAGGQSLLLAGLAMVIAGVRRAPPPMAATALAATLPLISPGLLPAAIAYGARIVRGASDRRTHLAVAALASALGLVIPALWLWDPWLWVRWAGHTWSQAAPVLALPIACLAALAIFARRRGVAGGGNAPPWTGDWELHIALGVTLTLAASPDADLARHTLGLLPALTLILPTWSSRAERAAGLAYLLFMSGAWVDAASPWVDLTALAGALRPWGWTLLWGGLLHRIWRSRAP